MTPSVRKLALTAHVVASVGWLGAVASFLALALAGVTVGDAELVRAAYVAADLVTWWVIVPLSGASLVTGLVQALGTTWGLFRHYWVLAKLLLTVAATAGLLLHTRPIGFVARSARARLLAPGELSSVRTQLIVDAAAALVVLLITTALSVFKPRGLTRYGWRKQHEDAASAA